MKGNNVNYSVLFLDKMKKQQDAIQSGNLTLKKALSFADLFFLGLAAVGIATFYLIVPILLVFIGLTGFGLYRLLRKNIYVENVATGEKFYLTKNDWKKYKADNPVLKTRSLEEV